jgi:hypothetical protein
LPLFDCYVMTDWSGGGRRRGNRPDAIWIAHGGIGADAPTLKSPFSRTEASEIIRCILEKALNNRQRVLVCFDFAYGYPTNFSAALQVSTRLKGSAWNTTWRYLHNSLKDDEGTGPSRAPTNRSNRFEVANKVNALMSTRADAAGPFWCTPRSGSYAQIPQNRPDQPFETAQRYFVRALRLTDERIGSDTPFRLFGTGSVGSQVLTGIPRLHNLRTAHAQKKAFGGVQGDKARKIVIFHRADARSRLRDKAVVRAASRGCDRPSERRRCRPPPRQA